MKKSVVAMRQVPSVEHPDCGIVGRLVTDEKALERSRDRLIDE